MTTPRNRPILPFISVAVAVLLLDQATKWMVVSHLSLFEKVPVIDGLFAITHITNTGAAFGILKGAEKWRHLFFQVISFMALGGILYLYKTLEQGGKALFWGMSLVFGGALGNLVDRIRYGHVIDFLDFYVGSWHWPAFNIADSAITIGAICLCLHFFKDYA